MVYNPYLPHMNPAYSQAARPKGKDYNLKDEDINYEFGNLSMMSDWIEQLVNNPQYGQIWDYLQQGFDPRVRQQINNLPGLQQQILGGGYFGDEQAQTYRDLISGETLRDFIQFCFKLFDIDITVFY